MLELIDNTQIIGATYTPKHYQLFEKTGNKNLFEEVIDMMMLKNFSEEFKQRVMNMPLKEKRMAILSLLDKDRNLFLRIKSLINGGIGKFEHIKDVIKMLREYVKVGEVEKKKYGEVMTPLELVKEMLSTLPEEVWSNPDLKWLDPANGTGPYPLMVIYKLMNGLKEWEPNEEKRYKHIVENMIYVCELQPKNMFLYMCAVDPWDMYHLNIYTGSFLTDGFDKHMKEVWNVDKFDIIMGNPPYNDNTGKVGKTAATLWPRFIQKSIEDVLEINGYLLFITPISWMSPGKQLIRNRSMPIYFKCNQFMYLNLDSGKYFDVSSYFSYYLIKCINRYSEEITVKSETTIVSFEKKFYYDFSNFDFIPIPKNIHTLSICEKILNMDPKIKLCGSSFTRSDKTWVSKIKDDSHIYPVKHTNTEILWSSKIPESYNLKKVIVNSTGNFNPFYDNGELGTTQITRWIEVLDENEGSNLLKYFNSKLIRFYLEVCRWSGAASKVVFEKLPLIDVYKEWTDEQLFEYFNLTEEERNLILNYDKK